MKYDSEEFYFYGNIKKILVFVYRINFFFSGLILQSWNFRILLNGLCVLTELLEDLWPSIKYFSSLISSNLFYWEILSCDANLDF